MNSLIWNQTFSLNTDDKGPKIMIFCSFLYIALQLVFCNFCMRVVE